MNLNILIDENNTVVDAGFRNRPDVMLLDQYAITERLIKLSESDPYFARRNVPLFVEKSTRRIADRMARSFSRAWAAPKEMVAEAIYFDLWSQLCTIIPLRRLARSIERESKEKKILIVLPELQLECFNNWHHNDLEPLILCWALQKQGGDVHLLCPTVANEATVRLELRPSRGAIANRGGDLDSRFIARRAPIIAPDGIRGAQHIDDLYKSVILSPTMPMSWLPIRPIFFGLEPTTKSANFSIVLSKQPQSEIAGLKQFSLAWPADPLSFVFDTILRAYFVTMVQRVRSFLADHQIDRAHVCDHLFLGSAILAHAVKERGGVVTLWPHSANPVSSEVRSGEYFDKIVVMTRAAEAIWKRRFPGKPVSVVPQLMLPPQRGRREFVTSAPITVILFAGSYFLARLPLFRIESHIKTYRRFFALSREASASARIKFKPKGSGRETVEWLNRYVIESPQTVEVEAQRAVELNYPNMLFLTIGHGSTALIEGIACGVPCMIVREQEIDDYTTLTADVVPTGSPEFIWEKIKALHNPGPYKDLIEHQIAYLKRQTEPDPAN